MKNILRPLTAQFNALVRLSKRVNKLLRTGKIHTIAPHKRTNLLAKLQNLGSSFAQLLPAARLRHVLGAAAVLVGISANAQNQFALPQENPFGFTPTCLTARLAAGDLDNDGDMDLLAGDTYGDSTIYFYENTGTLTTPNFSTAPVANPFGYAVQAGSIALADMDNDGDLDLVMRRYINVYPSAPQVSYIPNSGTPTAPNFSGAYVDLFEYSDFTPQIAVADMDNDGDLDITIGSGFTYTPLFSPSLNYFENTGSASTPTFSGTAGTLTGLPVVDYMPNVSFADMDNDGDLDAWLGGMDSNYAAVVQYATNASSSAPSFSNVRSFPMGMVDTFATGNTALLSTTSLLATDIDGDGDIDLLATDYTAYTNTSLKFYENTRCDALSAAIAVSGNSLQIANTGALASFQWYKDSTLLANATGNTIDINMYGSGLYMARVTDTMGCIAYTPSQGYWIVGVNKTTTDDNQLRCMPNPVVNQLFIESALSFERFDIINAQGQIVRSIEQPNSQQINTSDLAQGIYTLRGYTAKGTTHATRFVKQ